MTRLSRRLLVVDDDTLFGEVLRDELSSDELQVVLAPTCAEALRLCREDPVDVVLLDQRLPDGPGATICPAILEANDRTKIVFATAHPSFENALEAVRAGAVDYVSKPCELEQVRMVVSRCLRLLDLERVERRDARRRELEARDTALVGETGGLMEVARLVELAAGSDVPVLLTGETGTRKDSRGPRHSLQERETARRVRLRQLRLAAGEPHRGRALRTREGCLHGGVGRPGGALRGRGGGDPPPRRDRRHAPRPAGEAPDGPGRPAGPSGRRTDLTQGRFQAHGGDERRRRRGPWPSTASGRTSTTGSTSSGSTFRRSGGGERTSRRWRSTSSPARARRRAHRRSTQAEVARLQAYDWPGNLRELRNVLERAALVRRAGEPLRPSAFLSGGARR